MVPRPTTDERRAAGGFVLVAVTESGEIVGFAHVIETAESAHLEQVSVLPEHGRRGYGRQLLSAAKGEATRRGHDRMTLRAYADVPWNAPFYALLGFVEVEPTSATEHAMEQAERAHGLARHGRRIQMMNQLA